MQRLSGHITVSHTSDDQGRLREDLWETFQWTSALSATFVENGHDDISSYKYHHLSVWVIIPPNAVNINDTTYVTHNKGLCFFDISYRQFLGNQLFHNKEPFWLSFTLPETNNSHLKMDGWNTILSFWDSAYFQRFDGSFGEGK